MIASENKDRPQKGIRQLFDMMDASEPSFDAAPDMAMSFAKLKSEVFSTLDVVNVIAEVIELFTVNLAQTQADVWDAVQEVDYWNEDAKLFEYLAKRSKKAYNEAEEEEEDTLE